MAPQLNPNTSQEEWLKVLGKGMVTIPKKWRDDLGIAEGDIIKATKQGKNVVLTSPKTRAVPYRIYTDDEIKTFLKDDRL
ncbi:hypothetical protein A2971_04890 [Candidatus Gottesmanbacteria bacterium RIFCSPLOWO2_01_FULL_46_21]|uniref:SpoVT-AbrB domain-containing protein n=1 Tax=Candidatus Gottesmanbacteria bacterium RIFCSPLOWO2_01_FULL_46_21 TaxID=1798393 RepID=A0A1F6AW81_9BACT|nr:MAG: hypothetical protein A2971_04890 [Candidatus Gottesmanbacteria bacterium RIFCSPLOWO2_01_FULL_46_21]